MKSADERVLSEKANTESERKRTEEWKEIAQRSIIANEEQAKVTRQQAHILSKTTVGEASR